MLKKLMHIMVDSYDKLSELDYEKIYKAIESQKLESEYDIVITTSDMTLTIYDNELLQDINIKLDYIIDKLDDNSNVIKNIKHVIGGINGIVNR